MSRINHYASIEGIPSLAEAFYLAGREYRGGITALAIDMEMDYEALVKKLNPTTQRFLDQDELERFLKLADSNEIDLALCRASQAVIAKRIPMESKGDCYRALAKHSLSSAKLCGLLAEAQDLGEGSLKVLWPRLERALFEHAQLVLGIVEGVKESHGQRL